MGGESSKVKADKIAKQQAELHKRLDCEREQEKQYQIAREKELEKHTEIQRRKTICGGWICDYFNELEPFIPTAREIVKKTKTYSALPVSGETIVELAISYTQNSQIKLLVDGFDLTVMIIATILYSCSKGKHNATIIVGGTFMSLPHQKADELLITFDSQDCKKHTELIDSGYFHPLAGFLKSENIIASVWQESYPWYGTFHRRLKIDFDVKSQAPPMYKE
jgi:hypothetical protein